MASIIDEYKVYLNTPRKIILFRFGISLAFFLLGLTMVTRVRLNRKIQFLYEYIREVYLY
jgi:hypothetical protein